jgi:phosphatidate cytidylyltransferase
MGTLVLGCTFAGREVLIVFFAIVAIFALKEFARATGLYHNWWLTSAVYLGVVAGAVICIMDNPFTGQAGWYGMYMALPVYVVAAILLIPIVRNQVEGQLQAVALALVAFLYIGWMFGHLGLLADSRYAYGYVLFLLFAVEVTDVAAFVFGRLLGRHPLRSNISPNKTWEGALGALGVAMALPWLLRFSFPHFGTVELILTGLIVGVGGQLGDLSISFIKRDMGVKDMGAAIHGHGGVLDRIDSLIYSAPLFLHMTRYFHDLY